MATKSLSSKRTAGPFLFLLAIGAVGCSKAGEEQPKDQPRSFNSTEEQPKDQPRSFNSTVSFRVYTLTEWYGVIQSIGTTPCKLPLEIPPGQPWLVEPIEPMDMNRIQQEVQANGIPGLRLPIATDDDLAHLQGLTGLRRLYLSQTRVTDAGLEHLKGLTGLQWLNLEGTKVTDAGLEHLKGLTGLQWLNIVDTKVTDAGLEHLKGLTGLQELYLGGTKVMDAGLEHLKGLTGLQRLYLRGTKVTDAGVAELQKSLPRSWIAFR